MQELMKKLQPDRDAFAADPFGYAALAWQRWAIALELAGEPIDSLRPPTTEDLKSPLLWLSQAHALSEAAVTVLRADPKVEHLPLLTRGVCDSQYRAVGLMLVGYSLEMCLKGMLILEKGVQLYSAEEKSHKHHRLVELAELVPSLNEKDKAILQLLTEFVYWAGRYPDPGSGREDNLEAIFSVSERHQIAAKDLFGLASKVMQHAAVLTA
ncbi:MAG: hypothetical protein QM776_08310 [Rhodocyclaceae bacterium]